MKSKSRASLVVLIALMVIVAACGGADDDGPPPGGEATDGQAAGGEGQTIQLTLGAGHPAGGAITYTNWSESFFVPEIKKRVSEETNHTLEVNEAYGGSIAPLAEVLEATRDGLLDIGLVPFPFEPSELFLHNIAYYVPFGSPDPELTIRVLRQTMEANPELITVFEEDFNQKMLALAGVGDYGLVTTFAWDEVSELEGKKITAAGPNLPWIEPVGAVPVQGNLNEWYTSLQTGVVEGAIMFPEATAGFKLYEPAPNYKHTHFGAIAVGSININLDTLNNLPEEVATIIEEVAAEYEETIGAQIKEEAAAAIQTMEEAGTEITELSDEERAAWAESLPNIPAQKAKEADDMGLPGTKAMTDYLNFMEEEGYTFPRRWQVEG